jgi:hypothetical protein
MDAAAERIPLRLLGNDIDGIRTKDGIRRAVVEVLRELGFLDPAPKRPPPVRLVKDDGDA